MARLVKDDRNIEAHTPHKYISWEKLYETLLNYHQYALADEFWKLINTIKATISRQDKLPFEDY
jgi:hypothetical protein